MDNKEKYHICWDKKDKIVRAKAIGVLDEKDANGILEATVKIAKEHGEKIDWLIDLSLMTKVTSRARKVLAIATSHPSINKYAFIGASIFIRTIANFISSAAGQKNARHFTSEREALNWIKGNH